MHRSRDGWWKAAFGLGRLNREFVGLLNRCPHQGAALCEGPLTGLAQSSDPGEIIRCPWHGREFDIRTGQSCCDPKASGRGPIRPTLSRVRMW